MTALWIGSSRFFSVSLNKEHKIETSLLYNCVFSPIDLVCFSQFYSLVVPKKCDLNKERTAQSIKVLDTKCDDLSLVPGSHMVGPSFLRFLVADTRGMLSCHMALGEFCTHQHKVILYVHELVYICVYVYMEVRGRHQVSSSVPFPPNF